MEKTKLLPCYKEKCFQLFNFLVPSSSERQYTWSEPKMDWLIETTALENGSPQRESRSEVHTNTYMDKHVYTCPYMYTHSVRTSVASFCVLSYTMCFSATSTVLGTSAPQGHTAQDAGSLLTKRRLLVIWGLICSRHRTKCFTHIILFVHATPPNKGHYDQLPDEESEAGEGNEPIHTHTQPTERPRAQKPGPLN